jgi:hypothetical protein
MNTTITLAIVSIMAAFEIIIAFVVVQPALAAPETSIKDNVLN